MIGAGTGISSKISPMAVTTEVHSVDGVHEHDSYEASVAARTARYTAEHLVYQTQQRILGSEQTPMMVVDYHLWDAVGHIPRSSEGFARGVRNGDSVVFISHRWWEDQPPITGDEVQVLQ